MSLPDARTPPYLPFLEGAPSLAPGLKPIDPAHWLTPDTEAAAWLPEKRQILRTHRSDVYAAVAGAEAAIQEAAARVHAVAGRADGDWPSALEAAASTVSDDLCLLLRDDAGLWRLVAASLVAPTFWRLADKIGEPLGGLHAPVPGANPALVQRISRMFDALRPGQVLERFNWTVQAGNARFTPSQLPSKALAAATAAGDAGKVLHQRVERQTICKLPVSGAVIFTIRIVIDPLRNCLQTPEHRTAFRKAWSGISPELHAYKGWPSYDHLVAAL
jgi:dimethylamine monooxygenase subunit A